MKRDQGLSGKKVAWKCERSRHLERFSKGRLHPEVLFKWQHINWYGMSTSPSEQATALTSWNDKNAWIYYKCSFVCEGWGPLFSAFHDVTSSFTRRSVLRLGGSVGCVGLVQGWVSPPGHLCSRQLQLSLLAAAWVLGDLIDLREFRRCSPVSQPFWEEGEGGGRAFGSCWRLQRFLDE